ncbi:neuronal acetylcholine receptor subunit alpha-7-like [Acropora millepora]|uniref:neuronal acetylcholine receptor subunit alpha-7-like n=1 Tax=Acropora millepora TaxID=45264 RepID=UPI001CF3543E|nr:neuronal acetylcholine receptor subunit alpha-7-like [Acropora millepora]
MMFFVKCALFGLFIFTLEALKFSRAKTQNDRNWTQWDSVEARLRRKLFQNDYDPELRPVLNQSDQVTVTFGVSLHQIIVVDEKNQFITVSLWIRQTWFNSFLMWNPQDFQGMKQININANKVWMPDLYLYNNAAADKGGALDQFKTKIVLSSNGKNMWLGPILMTFSCKIDVNYFPFDEQICSMKFGSWTYDGYRLDVQMEKAEGDIKKYVSNGEWDLISLTAQRNELIYICCPEPYPDVTYTLHIRRRTKYYYINLIIPCVLITSLTLLSFFLPPDSGERITLVITNLLAMTVFMLIVAEIMPATSEVIPLISIYYTGIMFEVALSLVATCIVLRCYYSNPSVCEIPTWVRVVVLTWLAGLVRIKVPTGLVNVMEKHVKEEEAFRQEVALERRHSILPSHFEHRERSCSSVDFHSRFRTSSLLHSGRGRCRTMSSEREHSCDADGLSSVGLPRLFEAFGRSLQSINEEKESKPELPDQANVPSCFEDASVKEMLLKLDSLLNNVRRLVQVTRQQEENDIKREEWKLVASIIDACFFWVFMAVLVISSVVIFLQAPDYN